MLPGKMATPNDFLLLMTSPTKFYHVIQIIMYICSCEQSLVTLAFLWEKLSQPYFYNDLTRKTAFFEGRSWLKFNKLGLALGKNLKFNTSVPKGLKLKVRKFCWLIFTFVEVTGEKVNRVKVISGIRYTALYGL